MNLKFLRYDPTPGEKHAGIATVRIEEGVRIILRFKVVPKDGGGFYCQPASHKISAHGKDNYYPAFAFDSSYENDCVKEFVLTHVKSMVGQKSQHSQFNAHSRAFHDQSSPQPQQVSAWNSQANQQQNSYSQERPVQPQNYQEQMLPF